MRCDFEYCVYNDNSSCILDEVEINSIGQCETCIIVSFPKENLAKYKRSQLQEIIRRIE